MWVSSDEALQRLGVKSQTLYANVSRGRIRAKADPADPRRSLYFEADIERLSSRAPGRRPTEAVAAEAIRWGEPVLDSGVSTVRDGRLLYRGQDAVVLSQTATLEDVARLLWPADSVVLPVRTEGRVGLDRAFVALAERVPADLPTYGRGAAALRSDAASVLATMVDCLAGHGDGPVHQRLARRWKRPDAADPLRRALVLLADHELNASTFTARVAVSTGASLSAGTLAALAALTGPLHGTAAASVQALMKRAAEIGAEPALREVLAQGRTIPAFGHPLYPSGDVRAQALLASMPVPPLFAEMAEIAEGFVGEAPNIDFALATLAAAYDLPDDAPTQIFALGRNVGWLAHMLEQVETGKLIRPRARFTGLVPSVT